MKVYCITIYGNEISEKGYENLVESSKHVGNDFEIEKFPATHGQYADIVLKGKRTQMDLPMGRTETRFLVWIDSDCIRDKDKKKIVSVVFLSHYNAWEDCLAYEEPILVLEHDGFTKKLDYHYILESKYDIIGINDPRGCTRKSKDLL